MYNFPSAFAPIYFPQILYFCVLVHFFMNFCLIMQMRGLSFKVRHGVNFFACWLIDIIVHGSAIHALLPTQVATT